MACGGKRNATPPRIRAARHPPNHSNADEERGIGNLLADAQFLSYQRACAHVPYSRLLMRAALLGSSMRFMLSARDFWRN